MQVRYTNDVSKGSRNPEADDLPIFFLFLFFTPFYFVNDRKAPPTRSPASRGVFLSGKTEKSRFHRFQKLFKDCSKSVHT